MVSPSWRARDVRRDIDVVEEVARFRLEEVPATLPVRQAMFGRLNHFQRLRRQVEDVLVGAGLYEAYTYSLQAEDPDPDALELPVPLSSQQRLLRTTLTVGLIGAARHNVDMGNHDVELFEVAHVYLPVAGSKVPRERWRLGGILQGDFFRAKGIVEAVFEALHVEPTFERAQVLAGSPIGARVQSGWVAQHGPVGLGLDGEWSAFELDLEDLFALVPERILYRDVITFPPLRQDLAFVVDDNVPGGRTARGRPRGGGRGAAGGAVPQRLSRRPDPGGEEVGRVRGRVPVARAHAVGRGRDEAPRRGRRCARGALRCRTARLTRGGRFGAFQPGSDPGRVRSGHGCGDKSANLSPGGCRNAQRRRYRRRQWHATSVSKLPTSSTTSVRAASRSGQIFDCAHRDREYFLELLAQGRPEVRAGRSMPIA